MYTPNEQLQINKITKQIRFSIKHLVYFALQQSFLECKAICNYVVVARREVILEQLPKHMARTAGDILLVYHTCLA